jgi:hypothetical protein
MGPEISSISSQKEMTRHGRSMNHPLFLQRSILADHVFNSPGSMTKSCAVEHLYFWAVGHSLSHPIPWMWWLVDPLSNRKIFKESRILNDSRTFSAGQVISGDWSTAGPQIHRPVCSGMSHPNHQRKVTVAIFGIFRHPKRASPGMVFWGSNGGRTYSYHMI